MKYTRELDCARKRVNVLYLISNNEWGKTMSKGNLYNFKEMKERWYEIYM